MEADYQTPMLMNSPMTFSTAFREAMSRYRLRGSDLSKRSGISASQISRFRAGQNISVASLVLTLMECSEEIAALLVVAYLLIDPQ